MNHLAAEQGGQHARLADVVFRHGHDVVRKHHEIGELAGFKRADAIPFRSWLDAGVPVAQSTDGRPYDPIFSFWQMLARRDGVTGHVFGLPGQKLTRHEALRLYTHNPARAAFWEHRIGSLEPGKLADLVVLSDDIMTMPEDDIREARVLATLLGGEAVHDTGLFG